MKESKIGLWSLTALVFSSMVGAGIFSLPQNMAEVAGARAVLIGWGVTGVGILALAASFLYLSRLRPDLDGGIYSYARAGFGDLVGFFSAWGYWLCATIGVVVIFGVSLSTLLSLFVVPAFYAVIAPYTRSPEALARQLAAEEAATPSVGGHA